MKLINKINLTLLLICIIFSACSGSGNSGNTNTTSYNSWCNNSSSNPPLNIFFKSIKITDKKDKFFGGKDDVGWVGTIYNDGQCNGTPFINTNLIKVSNSQINQTLPLSASITFPPILLCPNSTIAMVLYEHDNTNNANGQWNFVCSTKLYFDTNNEPYGTFYIRYSDFSTTSTSEKTYYLSYGEVTIQSRLY